MSGIEKEIYYVCFDCGNHYLTDKQKERNSIVTAHKGECGLCKKITGITHIRAFNWLNKVKKWTT